jgi:transposase
MPLRRYEHVSGTTREETRAAAAKLYAEGSTVRHIATDLGRSSGFVHRLLVESGVELRSRGARSRVTETEIPGQLELETAPV